MLAYVDLNSDEMKTLLSTLTVNVIGAANTLPPLNSANLTKILEVRSYFDFTHSVKVYRECELMVFRRETWIASHTANDGGISALPYIVFE